MSLIQRYLHICILQYACMCSFLGRKTLQAMVVSAVFSVWIVRIEIFVALNSWSAFPFSVGFHQHRLVVSMNIWTHDNFAVVIEPSFNSLFVPLFFEKDKVKLQKLSKPFSGDCSWKVISFVDRQLGVLKVPKTRGPLCCKECKEARGELLCWLSLGDYSGNIPTCGCSVLL